VASLEGLRVIDGCQDLGSQDRRSDRLSSQRGKDLRSGYRDQLLTLGQALVCTP